MRRKIVSIYLSECIGTALLAVLLFKMPVLKWWTILPKLWHPRRPMAETTA